MKKTIKIKYLIIGICIIAASGLIVMPSMAAVFQKQITVSTGVNVYVDDVKLNPVDGNGKPVEVFIYNGTTYLPVRAVSEAVGKAVLWEGKTNSVYLGKHDSKSPSVMLHELDYFYQGGYGLETVTRLEDNLGNLYNDAIGTFLHGSETYYINGKYNKLKGKYVLDYKYRSIDVDNIFKVYGDGKIIYTSPVIKPGVHPVNFEIDLTGVLELKIEINGSHGYIVDAGLYQ